MNAKAVEMRSGLENAKRFGEAARSLGSRLGSPHTWELAWEADGSLR